MRFIRALLTVHLAAFATWSMFMPPSNAPVERLVSNVGEYVKSHPQDPKGYYTLGRIHYLAFALKTKTLRYHGQGDSVTPFNDFRPGRAVTPRVDPLSAQDKERAAHLQEALRLLKKAIELAPGNALYELGLACVYEDGQPSEGAAEWRELAIGHYLAAYLLAFETDQAIKNQPLFGIQTLVSFEAGESYLRLVKERGAKEYEAPIVKLIEEEIAVLQKLPHGPITPIVLSLRSGATLDGLLAPETRVKFDLDGTGREQSYSWLQPDAAFLVWDPEHTGRITSGRQLFGTVTWWMFWENGYQALASLDDDRDGWLRGRELNGLALWFDRNQNGISDPGEVIPIEQAGIEALAVNADASLMNQRGAVLKDGRVLPTWDWVATPLAPR
jgi:hypothetical protein